MTWCIKKNPPRCRGGQSWSLRSKYRLPTHQYRLHNSWEKGCFSVCPPLFFFGLSVLLVCYLVERMATKQNNACFSGQELAACILCPLQMQFNSHQVHLVVPCFRVLWPKQSFLYRNHLLQQVFRLTKQLHSPFHRKCKSVRSQLCCERTHR